MADRQSELKAFDETKAGVKGLVDSGITKIPRIFHHPQPVNPQDNSGGILGESNFNIPVVDVAGIQTDPNLRAEVIVKLREACESCGFFQLIHHGIPLSFLDEVRDGIYRFHYQPVEDKKQFYSRDYNRKVLFNSNYDLYKAPACWRDTLTCVMRPNPPSPEELPAVCRDVLIDLTKRIKEVGITLFQLLSESLGLNPNHLEQMGCAEGLYVMGHCYPPCPQPELTMGLTKHTDSGFLTLLLQHEIGGLQVFLHNQWHNVEFIPGALVVNVGDLFQLITNDKFVSVKHRVIASRNGPRISVACNFRQQLWPESGRVYGPIKELLSENNPQVYRETSVKEFVERRHLQGNDGVSSLLQPLKLSNITTLAKQCANPP